MFAEALCGVCFFISAAARTISLRMNCVGSMDGLSLQSFWRQAAVLNE
jgi:hypothetical protein